MQPWFIATEPFRPGHPEWARFIEWSGLSQLKEVVFDPILCPTVLPEIKAEYWPHIVNEDFMLQFFVNYDFFREQVAGIPAKNVLCVVRNPEGRPALPASLGRSRSWDSTWSTCSRVPARSLTAVVFLTCSTTRNYRRTAC